MWLLLLLLALVLIFIYGYNRIVSLEVRAERAWADIDVQLKRIAELVPNLINTLKGSASFERSTLESIADAHARLVRASGPERVEAASKFIAAVYPIVYQIPQYPDLKTTEEYAKLMDELRYSLDKLSYARQFYNQAVQEYNTFISQFPWNILAALLSKRPRPYFTAPHREEIERRLESGELTAGL